MKRLLKPLENGCGSQQEEELFVEALFSEIQKVDVGVKFLDDFTRM